MPRIRSIKPEHWNDKYLPKISVGAHLLWIGMWNFSDDKGVIEYDCSLIKADVFPRRKEIRPIHIEKWIKELIKYEFIIPFQHKGIQYLIHRTFDVHQRIDKPQKSKIDEDLINRTLNEHSTNDIGTVVEQSKSVLRKDRIGKDKEGNGEDKDSIGEGVPENFALNKIYNKDFKELKKSLTQLSESGFIRWKKFVDFLITKKYSEIFNCKFVNPQDFEKLDFPESKWDATIKSILATGVKPEQNLFFRIPQFLNYGLNGNKSSTQSAGSGLSGTSLVEPDKEYKGRLGH